jgi:hypothetical protein
MVVYKYDGWKYIHKALFVKTETATRALTDTRGQRRGAVISRLGRLPHVVCQRLFAIKLVHTENHDNCKITGILLKSLPCLWSIDNIFNLFFVWFYHPIWCRRPDPDFFIWKMNTCRLYVVSTVKIKKGIGGNNWASGRWAQWSWSVAGANIRPRQHVFIFQIKKSGSGRRHQIGW